MVIKRGLVLSVGLILLSSRAYATSVPSIADPFPNAGTVYSGLDQTRKWMPQTRKAEVKLEMPQEQAQSDIVTITVKGIAIEGQTIFAKETLDKVIKDKIKGKMSLKDLNDTALELRKFFRRNGYFAAYVYVPEQNVVGGIVVIKIMPGIYGKVTMTNTTRMRSDCLEDFMKPIQSGSYIQRRAMDRTLLIMNDLPGIKVEATLKPGSKSGEADASFVASTLEKQGGAVFIDNYGNRYTGRNRIGVSYHINNPAELGDQLSFYYMKSNGELNNYDVRYEIPVGDYYRAGTVMGLSFTKMDYELGAPYDQYDAYGNAETWQLYTKTPLKRMLHNNLYLRTSIESRQLTDKIDRWLQDTQKASQVVRIGLEGDYRTNKTASTYKFTQSFGWMHMDSDTAKRYDYYNTEGPFQKSEVSLYHIIRANNRLQIHLSASAQYAWSDLDSSEKFYIGGYNAVRSFPQGESGGDSGVLGTIETRWMLPNQTWQLAAFVDGGHVMYNKHSSGGDTNSRNLCGWGLGILWNNSKNTSARLDVAFPLSDNYSQNDGGKINQQWWFQLIQRI
ncbi:Heme/hemopexin transporter protein HuxB [bioreactor metagenome]|jgi:Hemolysin activation/secretion protein|uniref:Heme/hemopexin transporter protein HuxB n=1 Tax=bioreactor metagenome TaxID=1076179 RepID=A0A644UJ32_9ZZZZ|nr:ShlB/FhaC/HecB family hemolysin secretion/activation protein [Acidaminococcaceae bacterium]